MGQVRVRIDRDACITCGTCWAVCPEVFEDSAGDGLSQIVAKHQVDGDPGHGQVPGELERCAREASDLCPMYIIHVEGP